MTQHNIESKVTQVIKEELGEDVALKTIGRHSTYTPIKDLDLETLKPKSLLQDEEEIKEIDETEDLYGLKEIKLDTEGADDLKNLNFDTLSQLEDFDEVSVQFKEEKEELIEMTEDVVEENVVRLDETELNTLSEVEDLPDLKKFEEEENDEVIEDTEYEVGEEVNEEVENIVEETPKQEDVKVEQHRGRSMVEALNKLEDDEVTPINSEKGTMKPVKKSEVVKIENYSVPALIEEAQATQSALVKQVLSYEDVPALANVTSVVWEIKSKVEEIHPPVKLLIERIMNSYIQILTQEGRIFITLDEADINAQLLKTHPSLIPSLEKIGFMVVDSVDEPVIAVKSLTQLSEFFGKDFLSYRNEARDKVFKDFLSEMEVCINQGRRIAIPLTEEVCLETFEGFKTYIPPRLTVEELKVFIIHTTSKYGFQHKVWNDHLFLWRAYNA